MLINDIATYLESLAPISYQESYDNAGLLTGRPEKEINSALITLDVTEDVVDEAASKGCGLIISHHPLIFKGIKKLTGSTLVERCLINAVKKDIAIYAAHTNLDNISGGVNRKIGEKIGLINLRILSPLKDQLVKLVTFIPTDYLDQVREAVFSAGAGQIGNYDKCSYSLPGEGTFRAGDGTDPFIGKKGEFHKEREIRFETILPVHLQKSVVRALIGAHPYEEAAYDLYPLNNETGSLGSGMIGELEKSEDEKSFLDRLADLFNCPVIKHTALTGKAVRKVAFCGGSGSFLLPWAISMGADLFLTADIKYHDFFEAENRIIMADIGHYEIEQFTKELFHELLIKKFPNFALRLSEIVTNPVSYHLRG